MPASRAPWWLYIIAASFLGYFTLQIYAYIWGPWSVGFRYDYSSGSMIVQEVFAEGAGAGLRAGDRILVIDGFPIRGDKGELMVAGANFEPRRPITMKIEREGNQSEVNVSVRRGTLSDLDWGDWQWLGGEVLTLILALVIAFRKPHDPLALIGAWLLASSVFAMISVGYGWAAFWRHLPAPLGLLLWPGSVSRGLISGLSLTFAAIFPRKLFRARSPWILIWTPVILVAVVQLLFYLRLVYQPRGASTSLDLLRPDFVWSVSCLLLYLPATLCVWAVQYRRLEDLNERRRMRILFVGMLLCCLGVMMIIALNWLVPASVAKTIYATPIPTLLFTLYLAGPTSFAYAILRHRVFDLGVILRRGLQYALARRLLVSSVPVLAVVFLADLLLHGDQPILAVFRARGWVYAVLAALAAIAYTRRQHCLDALDRRFFREHYDARRILREVVEEVHAAKTFEEESPRAVAHIEAALHPEFAAMLVCQPNEDFYRTVAAAPVGKSAPPLQKESKLLSLVRLLGKPLEVPQTESGWLHQQLPHEETEFLRQARIDLLVPVTTDPRHTQALLALGTKRSEEPYSGEDQDLLVTIAASLAILLEKPPTAMAPRTDIFEECPQCGCCYDSGSSQCAKEGARLLPVILPRLLEERYLLQRRLGRGGMGTVYAASDALLERRVAVKVIREDLVGSAEAAERFRREARAAASFAHPNVVTVHDFGIASGTRAFLIMEILEGSTLRERLKAEKRLATEKLLCVVRDLCAALGSAHRRHLVHRDLKPENVFLVGTETGEVTKILDFGLAKFVAGSNDRTVDTATGAILGTVRYMSPEQREGQPADQAWDIWALAVTTYEMLTGCYPFDDGNRDRFAVGPVFPFTPIATHVPGEVGAWQSLFEHSFAREMSVRLNSAEAFLSELQLAASKSMV
jgi:tRNA A-37 threonylcarbamoyl transferase component Bud32